MKVSQVLQHEREPAPGPMDECQDRGAGKFHEFVDHGNPKEYDEKKLPDVSALKKARQDS